MATYVVAIKRGARFDTVSAEQLVRDIPGVEIKGADNPERLVIETSPEVALELQQRFVEKLVVEPIISYRKLSPD